MAPRPSLSPGDSWRDALDVDLVGRLWRRAEQPGLFRPRLGAAILRRHLSMVAGVPLAERLHRRWEAELDGSAAVPELIYARASRPPFGSAAGETARVSGGPEDLLRAAAAPGAAEPARLDGGRPGPSSRPGPEAPAPAGPARSTAPPARNAGGEGPPEVREVPVVAGSPSATSTAGSVPDSSGRPPAPGRRPASRGSSPVAPGRSARAAAGELLPATHVGDASAPGSVPQPAPVPTVPAAGTAPAVGAGSMAAAPRAGGGQPVADPAATRARYPQPYRGTGPGSAAAAYHRTAADLPAEDPERREDRTATGAAPVNGSPRSGPHDAASPAVPAGGPAAARGRRDRARTATGPAPVSDWPPLIPAGGAAAAPTVPVVHERTSGAFHTWQSPAQRRPAVALGDAAATAPGPAAEPVRSATATRPGTAPGPAAAAANPVHRRAAVPAPEAMVDRRSSAPQVDIDQIVDKVHRRLMQRLAVEGERRGMTG